MNNYEELIDKIDKTAAAFSNHLGDNNMSDFLREPIEAIKQLVAERDELVVALNEVLRAERASNRPPETVMQAEEKLDAIRKAVVQAEDALAKVGADKTGENNASS